MSDKHKVSWMSINDVTVSADGIDHAIVAAVRASDAGTEGVVNVKAHPVMRIENLKTREVTIVTVDQDYKVVKTHELDRKVQTPDIQ